MNLKALIYISLVLLFEPLLAQDTDGVVAFDLPIRNSLTFNRTLLNPTFSYVREQNRFISAYNKREWVQFNDAPLSYVVAYSGRFTDNIGAGISLFQQDYGVLTTYGGVINFAYNARLERDTNLTFGLNMAAYSSGINSGNVVTNLPDPSLNTIENNFLLAVNPGVNFGTTFLDFGISINNLLLYNIQTSELLDDVPNRGIQGHIMYTGYMSSRGFFDDSKFTGLLRSEFREDETIIAGNVMLSIPKGFWVQGGYNTKFGASAGLGLNITEEIALEYNYEMALGDISNFGPSHEITLAYRFKNEKFFDYNRQDEVTSLIKTNKKRSGAFTRYVAAKRKTEEPKLDTIEIPAKEETQEELDELEALQKAEDEERARKEAERLERERLAREKQAKLKAQQLAKEKAERLRLEKLERERIAREKAEQERLAKLETERLKKEKAEQERLAQLEAERLAEEKAEQERLAQLEAERIAKEKEQAELDAINNPKNELEKSMKRLIDDVKSDTEKQSDLLDEYDKAVEGKNENLKNLKEENDLSEQGIVVKPKPFKSITKENERLRKIKEDLDKTISDRSNKIEELEKLYDEMYEADTIVNEVVMLYYKKEITRLKSEQIKTSELRADLEKKLNDIQVAIEFEKRRRIKRAEFDNEEERYKQDRTRLANLKKTTQINTTELKPDDFDFGKPQNSNIQILKNINYVDSGYYAVLAIHSDIGKRDDFIKKVLASGLASVEFFYDVNTSKYYIYAEKVETIQEANRKLKEKDNEPYNRNMSIIKIEN
ncbi:MAG: type IX secretion system membrane protein PorP/SprF [Winogradskyella sp.]|uniref:PorP/SprF family type IX secretion system membrane protein n=1 Tax=Winogradskyella sp. TaxID=1883156 RepID=UPI000F3FF448|nr:PorP/SprF family type IX secretion system membrane protein [Winogradskyella sp.]RNC86238.1 MAG: type IX secretion system membrane protein PorP/SprF [Winogradskyella sp.]